MLLLSAAFRVIFNHSGFSVELSVHKNRKTAMVMFSRILKSKIELWSILEGYRRI